MGIHCQASPYTPPKVPRQRHPNNHSQTLGKSALTSAHFAKMSPPHSTAASAPGKVLLAGGYLVLDRAHTGLVFGLSARVHTVIADAGTAEGKISVRSPQFDDAPWEYEVQRRGSGGVAVVQTSEGSPNPFVQTTLSHVLSYTSALSPPLPSANVTILADDAYYTIPEDAVKKGRFTRFPTLLKDAHKTGLGSSAALVTALTAALLVHYVPGFEVGGAEGKKVVHNLAQVAHCAAQGKVGSGFDVAAATWGACRYRRFSPDILSGLGAPGEEGFAAKLKGVVEGKWDVEVEELEKLPEGLRLVMCDVDCGSATVGMVKQVLGWRGREPEEAGMLWSGLQGRNDALAGELRTLVEANKESSFDGLRRRIEAVRELVREMGRLADAPIEPRGQTELLDACSKVDGVVGGVVPGAGGYDAVALLVENREEVLEGLKRVLAGWKVDGGGRVGILDVREESEGVRMEE
ncbi:Phosphomevalonate kinase, partial [Trichodelitschia bisporula]